MLQQTRVEAVIPYYRRFLERFPSVERWPPRRRDDVLTAWSGLGYYSRARNLHRAAKQLAARGMPEHLRPEVLALPGVGPYTAAAIASIALGLPHAAVDGNVIRVISRLTNDPSEIASVAARRAVCREAGALLDPRRPGDFNQAMMELGATICLPRDARLRRLSRRKILRRARRRNRAGVAGQTEEAEGARCPAGSGAGRDRRTRGRSPHFPGKAFLVGAAPGGFLGTARPKHSFPIRLGQKLGEFSHRIVNDRFRIRLFLVKLPRIEIQRALSGIPPPAFRPEIGSASRNCTNPAHDR